MINGRASFVRPAAAAVRSAALGLLAAPAVLLAQEEAGGAAAELFGISLGLIFWTIVVFLVLLFILGRYAWGPILSAVEEREARIQGALDESARKQAEAQRLLDEHKRQLAEARREVQDIVAEGKEAGEKVRRDIEEQARKEGQDILERARRDIEREKDAAIAELRRESVELAMAAAARLMHERMDPAKDRQLVIDYLDELQAREGADA